MTMAEQMQVSTRTESDTVAVVEVKGEIDALTTSDLEGHIREAAQMGVKLVLADITSVEFIDSAGLGSLLKAWKTLHTAGVDLAVVSNQTRINRLFEITGLDQTFTVCPSVEEAVLHLSRG